MKVYNIIIIFLAMNVEAFPIAVKGPVIIDTSHYSTTFGEIRNYRIFLPPGYYDNPNKRYPVIYFFHGWSQRYFGPVGDDYSNYDKGDDNNGDNIANYVSDHDVMVVKPDGFNPYSEEEYNLSPYNEGEVKTSRQFPLYFPEIVDYIDGAYKTIADREHRAVSGLSMGGFMTFWIAGKYPHLVSAAGNFCGSDEFIVGPLKFPVEYRNIDMYGNYAGLNLRLNYGDKDNLRFYHHDMNRIWCQVMENYEYKIYDAHHTTCGMAQMFDFCLNTFIKPPDKPERWDHIDVYPEFSVWGYNVSSDRFIPGFTILEDVDNRGFRCSVREFLPDGDVMPFVGLSVTTPPVYEKNQPYIINDINNENSSASQKTLVSDNLGRLKFILNGGIHNIGINKVKDIPNLGIASVKVENMNWATTGKKVVVSINLFNKGLSIANNIKATLSSTKDYVDIINSESEFGNIDINEIKGCKNSFSFCVQIDSIEISRFRLTIKDGNDNVWIEFFELPLKMDHPEFKNIEIADGRTFIVAKAGIYTDTLLLGHGNGDGIANPGESIVILVKDQGKYFRTSSYSSDKYVNPSGINIRISDSWQSYDGIGGSAKYTVPLISSGCPENQQIVFFAEYWFPENKDHLIKQGTIKIKISGKDSTSPEVNWLYISGNNTILAKVFDGSAIVSVKARLIPVNNVKGLDYVDLKNPEQIIECKLNDEGKEGDLTGADRVFSKKISPPATYFYRVEIEAADTFGNKTVEKESGVFIVHSD